MPAHGPIADALWIYHISAVAVGKQERNGDRGVTLTFLSISQTGSDPPGKELSQSRFHLGYGSFDPVHDPRPHWRGYPTERPLRP